jgi:hypothetical protein
MTDARLQRLWRTGILSAFGALSLAVAAQGCGDDETTSLSGSGGSGSGSASGSGGSGSSSTSSGSNGGPLSFNLAADGPSAFDTTPDPEGTTLYFTGLTADGTPGVFKAPADGSATSPVPLSVGGVFTAPFGIAISNDGKQLYIADPGADVGTDKGGILALSVDGGEPSAVPGTQDVMPRNLEVADEEGKDVIYFTGTDKGDGLAGVFSVPASGGAASAVLKGDPFRDPSGIAIARDGTLYVADTVSSGDGGADIIKVAGGSAEVIVSGLRVGYPCGIALTTTDDVLFVSALDPVTLTDVVIKVDLATKEPTTLALPSISTFTEAAGLHRAKNVDVFGWADSSAGPAGGKVFVVK